MEGMSSWFKATPSPPPTKLYTLDTQTTSSLITMTRAIFFYKRTSFNCNIYVTVFVLTLPTVYCLTVNCCLIQDGAKRLGHRSLILIMLPDISQGSVDTGKVQSVCKFCCEFSAESYRSVFSFLH